MEYSKLKTKTRGIKNLKPISHTFLWNGIHIYRTRLRRRGIHFFEIEHTIQIHMALKNTKYVFESVIKHEQDCIHFFGLDYTNTKKEESQ